METMMHENHEHHDHIPGTSLLSTNMNSMNSMNSMNNDDDNAPFCNQMNNNGMSMYMTGFHSSLNPSHTYNTTTNLPCLNILSPKWTLDTQYKFGMAMVGIVFFALLLEFVAYCKVWLMIVTKKRQYRRSSSDSFIMHMLNQERFQKLGIAKLGITLLHGLQAFLGYLLMLVAMTYSIELLLCTILGLTIGHYISSQAMEQFQESLRGGNDNNDGNCCNDDEEGMDDDEFVPLNGSNGSPCCEFMEEPFLTVTIKDE